MFRFSRVKILESWLGLHKQNPSSLKLLKANLEKTPGEPTGKYRFCKQYDKEVVVLINFKQVGSSE